MGHRNGGLAGKGKGAAVTWLREHASHQDDACLIWPFSIVRGYGNVGINGKIYYAHRYMCEMVNGPPPTPKHQAAHSCGCGHAGCVNPRHLSWKTPSENQLDKREHGTAYKEGRRNKLHPQDVIAIRTLKGVRTQDELAEMFGVSRRNIGAILDGRSWLKLSRVQ